MKRTGRYFTQEDFSKLQKCLRCGLLGETLVCEICKPYQRCHVCTILLKPLEYEFYTYDIRNVKGVDMWVEFKYTRKNPYPPVNDNTCCGCVDWKSKWKENCFICGDKILTITMDAEKHYKSNGNSCTKCAAKL